MDNTIRVYTSGGRIVAVRDAVGDDLPYSERDAQEELDEVSIEESVETQGMSPSPAGSPEFVSSFNDITGSLLAELDGALKRATAITSALLNEVKRREGR